MVAIFIAAQDFYGFSYEYLSCSFRHIPRHVCGNGGEEGERDRERERERERESFISFLQSYAVHGFFVHSF